MRYWDMAATVQKPTRRHDPDWTVGALLGLAPDWRIFVADVNRGRRTPLDNERVVANVASQDGRSVAVRMEEEGGSSGKVTIDHYRRNVLPGFDFAGQRPSLSKEERARPLARQAK